MIHCLFTIGHSAAQIETFLSALKHWNVSHLMDVRSRPQSLRFPHFDQIDLQNSLAGEGIAYSFMGEELGGRPEDPKAYGSDGIVDYRKWSKSYAVQAGIERLMKELDQKDIALMCAEEDPLNCHRFLMICPELVALGVEPLHIRKGGVVETQSDADDRLLQMQNLGECASASLFAFDRERALETAYIEQAKKCAFRLDPAEMERWQAVGTTIFTIGFAGKTAEEFFSLLKQAPVRKLLDIRENRIGQLSGFAKYPDLAFFLDRIAGISYVYEPRLAPTPEIRKAYRANKDWAVYESAFLKLMRDRDIPRALGPLEFDGNVVLLCSEPEPEKCHRRLVGDILAEFLRREGSTVEVHHLVVKKQRPSKDKRKKQPA